MSRPAPRVFAAQGPWLFSRGLDLAIFGGSALAAYLLVALAVVLGTHADYAREAPEWSFLACVVAIDVAHVWSTGFRVYFDAEEVRRRPLLYLGLPALAYAVGVGAHALGPLAFWRLLAYVAVFHFLRQQAGFMALYRRKGGETCRLDVLLDQATIYATMLYPLIHWHASLPRRFAWFVQGDFVAGASRTLADAAGIACALLLGCFFSRQAVLARRGAWVPGKSMLVIATASCWIGGIVWCDSDFVFTVTNVLLHGVPYFVLTYRHARATGHASLAWRIARRGFPAFALVTIALAFFEESLWDGLVWHERAYLFGAHEQVSARMLVWVVPFLALPQLTHYLLDGFVWRVRSENPVLRRELE